jgi:hypothetical protein
MAPDAWRTDYWPEILGADGRVVFPALPLISVITCSFLAYLSSPAHFWRTLVFILHCSH